MNPILGPVAQNIRYIDYSGLGDDFVGDVERFRCNLKMTEAKLVATYSEDASLDPVTASLWC